MSEPVSYKKSPLSPYLRRSYSEDLVIGAFATPFRKKWMIVGILCFLVFPMILPSFFIHIANLIAIACLGSMALNLVVGTAGLLSLGHAGFMCAGAFSVGILSTHMHMPMGAALFGAALVGAILGGIASLPSFRLKGFYLGLSTLAMHFIIIWLVSEYQFYSGGSFGIEVKKPSLGFMVLSSPQSWYYFLGLAVWAFGLFVTNLLRSRPGRAWTALRDREIAARVMGIHVGKYKILAFVVSTSLTAIAGGLYAYYTSLVTVEEYNFWMTINYFAMIIIGGMGSLLGSIFGAFLITLTPYLLMYIFGALGVPPSIMDYFYALESGVFGIMIIVFLMVEPLGLIEIWNRIRTYLTLWPFKFKPLTIKKR